MIATESGIGTGIDYNGEGDADSDRKVKSSIATLVMYGYNHNLICTRKDILRQCPHTHMPPDGHLGRACTANYWVSQGIWFGAANYWVSQAVRSGTAYSRVWQAWALLTLEPHRHWLYHGLENVHVDPVAHRKLPEYDWPPQGWYLAWATVFGRAMILAAACSAATTIRAEGLVETIPGKMEASTTKRLSVP